MASSGESARSTVCATCDGEGGMGDERCAVIICPDCDGAGVREIRPVPADLEQTC